MSFESICCLFVMPCNFFFPKVNTATKKSDSFKTIKINKRKIALSKPKQTNQT